MNAKDLRTLRDGTGLSQAEAARRIGCATSTYARLERGESEITDAVAAKAEKALGMMQLASPDITDGSPDMVRRALGEAVLIMSPDQRDELYKHASRDLVSEAAARVAMGRIQGSLADALSEARRELRDAKRKIEDIDATVRGA